MYRDHDTDANDFTMRTTGSLKNIGGFSATRDRDRDDLNSSEGVSAYDTFMMLNRTAPPASSRPRSSPSMSLDAKRTHLYFFFFSFPP